MNYECMFRGWREVIKNLNSRVQLSYELVYVPAENK